MSDIYFGGITVFSLLVNGTRLLAGMFAPATIVIYALKRRRKPESGL